MEIKKETIKNNIKPELITKSESGKSIKGGIREDKIRKLTMEIINEFYDVIEALK